MIIHDWLSRAPLMHALLVASEGAESRTSARLFEMRESCAHLTLQ